MPTSIALCTYNGGKFLDEQLQSFLRQTRPPDELIVCDDGSSDDTVEIAGEFKETAPFPVHISVNEKNLGLSKNFERAISLCSGDIIFLSDQDDVWVPEKIEIIENEFGKSPEIGLVFSDAELVDENLLPLGENLWDYTFRADARRKFGSGKGFELLASGGVVTGATMAFKSDLRAACLPIPALGNFIHDGWISFVAYSFYEVVPINIPLIKYRQHGSQQIGVRDFKESEIVSGRPAGHSRRQTYQQAAELQTVKRKRLEMLKRAYETAVNKVADDGSRLKIKTDAASRFKQIDDEALQIISHVQTRRDMPQNRVNRIPKIVSELLKGNYHKFSNGLKSAALDFVETAEMTKEN